MNVNSFLSVIKHFQKFMSILSPPNVFDQSTANHLLDKIGTTFISHN